MKQKSVCLIFIIKFILFSCSTQQYNAESDFEFKIIENGTQIEIVKYIGLNTDVRIPQKINGLPVTVIGNEAFMARGFNNEFREFIPLFQLTSVTIPDSVMKIGSGAFIYNKLENIVIPESVTIIKHGAFAHNKLININIPEKITRIEMYTFAHNQLFNVNIPNSITHIGDIAFAWNQLSSIFIPDSVIYIGDVAFAGNNLTTVIIPKNVSYIGDRIFYENQLESITFSNNIALLENIYSIYNDEFIGVLINFGVRAGTYYLNNGSWKFREN